MSLDLVTNDLDDATHVQLDNQVLAIADDEPSIPSRAASLLATIVWTSKGLLDPNYENTPGARALVNECPDLVDKLRDAWARKSFKEIRNLSTFSVFAAVHYTITISSSRNSPPDFRADDHSPPHPTHVRPGERCAYNQLQSSHSHSL
jgi:hypothetical protein